MTWRNAHKRRNRVLRRAIQLLFLTALEAHRQIQQQSRQRMPHRGPLARPDFSPTPADVNVMNPKFQTFWNGFENSETESSAFWLCKMAQERGHWGPFTKADIEAVYGRKYKDGFTFNHLVERGTGWGIQRGSYWMGGGWIIEYRERYYFTEEFILRCHYSANRHDEFESHFPWKAEDSLNVAY